MVKKIFGLALITVFALCSYLVAEEDLEEQLTAEKEALDKVTAEVKVLDGQLYQIKKEYINADIQLRQELAAEEAKTVTTKGERSVSKELLRKAKERQAQLRKTYYEKKKPLAQQSGQLQHKAAQYRRKIANMEREIKKIKEDHYDKEYETQMAQLRQEAAQIKQERDDALSKLQSETDENITAITDAEKRATARKEILSRTRDKEVAIWQDYNKKKQVIEQQIDKVKAEHRDRVQKRQESKKQEQASKEQEALVKAKEQAVCQPSKKGPVCNFGPRR